MTGNHLLKDAVFRQAVIIRVVDLKQIFICPQVGSELEVTIVAVKSKHAIIQAEKMIYKELHRLGMFLSRRLKEAFSYLVVT